MTVFNKEQLKVFFEPNQNQNVRLWDLQDFVDSNNALKIEALSTNSTINALDDTVLLLPGTTDITLANLSESGPKTLAILNASGNTVTINPDPSDTIDDDTQDSLRDEQYLIYFPNVPDDNWVTLLNTGNINLGFAMAYAEDNALVTTITVVGVYEVVNAVYVDAGTSPNIEVNAQDITYLGLTDRAVAYDINASGIKDIAGSLTAPYSISLFKNGVRVSPKMSQEFTKQADIECSITGVVGVTEGDVLDVRIAGDSSAQDVTISDLQFRIIEISS